jgi:PhnB protein
MVHHIPEGYHAVTPYLVLDQAAKAIDFYKQVFGATEAMRMPDPSGRIGHAEIKIGNSHIMLSDEFPEMGFRGPKSLGGAPVTLMLYVDNADEVFRKAIAAGAQERQAMKDQFYGDRSGQIQDPFGHIWTIATHVEDVAPEEMERRAKQYFQQQGGG